MLYADHIEVKPRLRELDEKGESPAELYRQAFDPGFHCLSIPQECGGSGCGHTAMGIPGLTVPYLNWRRTGWGRRRRRLSIPLRCSKFVV